VECAGQISPLFSTRSIEVKPLVTECIASKLLEARGLPIVIEFSIRLKERRPGLAVTVLQCFDGGLTIGFMSASVFIGDIPFSIWPGLVHLKCSFSFFQRMNFDGQSITDPGSTRLHAATLITPHCAIGLRRPAVSAGRPDQCDEEAQPGHDPKLH